MRYKETSRYNKVSNFEETQIPLNVLNTTTTYTIVQNSEESRLDLVSLRVYGDPSYWWLIAMCNGIQDVSIVPIGLKLRIPSLL